MSYSILDSYIAKSTIVLKNSSTYISSYLLVWKGLSMLIMWDKLSNKISNLNFTSCELSQDEINFISELIFSRVHIDK